MIRMLAVVFLLASITPFSASAQNDTDPAPEFNASPVFDGGGMRMNVSLYGRIAASEPSLPGLLWPGDGISEFVTRGLISSSSPVLLGRVNGGSRVSVSLYRDSFLPGPVVSGNPVSNPAQPAYRAYQVSLDQPDQTDYRQWPANLGAPIDGNARPLFYGPSQMFWVMNDLDTTSMRQHNGCDPLGLEMRCLLYEPEPYDTTSTDALLLQVTYINHGADSIRRAYAGYYADADIRDPRTDLVGSDPDRSMVYAYEGQPLYDETGMPAVLGLVMLQTPAVTAPGERARWYNGWKDGARNIPVTAAVAPTKSNATSIRAPLFGVRDTHQWEQLLRGRGSDVDVIDPLTLRSARFWFTGDPVRGEGWLPEDGLAFSDASHMQWRPEDQRMLISAGPFDLAPGDTQQVTYAFVAARGATSAAAIHHLRDRVDYLHATFMQRRVATAFRGAEVRSAAPGRIAVQARYAGIPADLHAEVTDASGRLLATTPMDAVSEGSDWRYEQEIAFAEPAREGVNVSLLASWEGEELRLPGRVSLPVGGNVVMDGIEMLEEGDWNGRVAPDEDAKWFPVLVNRSAYRYDLFAQSYHIPDNQWLRIPDLATQLTVPSPTRPWDPDMGYMMLWRTSVILNGADLIIPYDVYDPGSNVWWDCRNRIPTDSSSEPWYDALMTQVRGGSDERLGVRLVDVSALQDRWYVASIENTDLGRTVTLHDSASGRVYFTGYGLDTFTGAAPIVDGFRVVRGTVTSFLESENTATEADLYVFNPRHVLLARSRKPSLHFDVSSASPQPLTDWTTLTLDLPAAAVVRAEVYTSLGQHVQRLYEGHADAGKHLLVWDGHWTDGRLARAGIYFVRISTGETELTRKIIVLR